MLTGSRRLAVLIYLVLARPRGLHSRDTLVALLWPESDQAAGRHALRNALHSLRRALGDELIVTAGDGLVGADMSRIECDAILVEADLAAGGFTDAMARYHGELLQGFFVSEAPEFERWVDAERRRMSEAMSKAAWQHAHACLASGDREGAIGAARWASAHAPDDEPVLRRLLDMMVEMGDHAGAVRAYEEFAERLKREYDAEPSVETQALVHALRQAPSADAIRSVPIAPRAVAPLAPARGGEESVTPGQRHRSRAGWVAVLAVVLVIALGVAVYSGRPVTARDAATTATLVVLPMENKTGNASLDYIAAGVPDDVARRLTGIGGMTIRSGARSEWPAATRHDYEEIGKRFRSTVLLRMDLAQAGSDSLEVRSAVVDLPSAKERELPPRRFTIGTLQELESRLVADVAGALFRTSVPQMPRAPTRAIDPESYRLTMEGWHLILGEGNPIAARKAFVEATRDPLNARAWAGLSSVWSALVTTRDIPALAGAEQAEAAASKALALDSTQGSALINLAFLRALQYRSVATASSLMQQAVKVDAGNPEVFMVSAAIYRHAWDWDKALDAIRIARQLDPITRTFAMREAAIDMCAERHEAALAVYDELLALDRGFLQARMGRVRALAAMRRYGEAIAEWRSAIDTTKDAAFASVLARASRDSAGYWTARHIEGAKPGTRVRENSTMLRAQRHFSVGDFTQGYPVLDTLTATRDFSLYRLPCQVAYDEVRHSPRFMAIVKKVGPLPAR